MITQLNKHLYVYALTPLKYNFLIFQSNTPSVEKKS